MRILFCGDYFPASHSLLKERLHAEDEIVVCDGINRRKAAVLSGIEMFRQLLGNECALLSFFQCECQQNSPDDAEQDNIRKIPMNAVLPCFHSLDGHYRSMGQALARGEGNQRAV